MLVPPRWKPWSQYRKLLRVPYLITRRALLPIDRLLARIGAWSRFAAGLYYAFVNLGYTYEQRGFLAGRMAYHRSLVLPHGTMALLRRNVHRIEKGLVMRPRRVPFAMDYIAETVDAFHVACQSKKVNSIELKWAHDVLQEYFKACNRVPKLTPLKDKFCSSVYHECNAPQRFVPYERDLSSPSPVKYDEFLQLAIRRRSVRWFLQESVPRNLIDKAIELGAYAPSACNRQPFQFRVFDDPELVRHITKIPFGTVGYAENIPCIVVIVGQQRNYFDERDRHLIYIDGALASMGFVFALECQGLSSCCINWPEVAKNDDRMAAALRLDRDERPIMLIAVGYPDPSGMVPHSAKKPLPVIRTYNFE